MIYLLFLEEAPRPRTRRLRLHPSAPPQQLSAGRKSTPPTPRRLLVQGAILLLPRLRRIRKMRIWKSGIRLSWNSPGQREALESLDPGILYHMSSCCALWACSDPGPWLSSSSSSSFFELSILSRTVALRPFLSSRPSWSRFQGIDFRKIKALQQLPCALKFQLVVPESRFEVTWLGKRKGGAHWARN